MAVTVTNALGTYTLGTVSRTSGGVYAVMHIPAHASGEFGHHSYHESGETHYRMADFEMKNGQRTPLENLKGVYQLLTSSFSINDSAIKGLGLPPFRNAEGFDRVLQLDNRKTRVPISLEAFLVEPALDPNVPTFPGSYGTEIERVTIDWTVPRIVLTVTAYEDGALHMPRSPVRIIPGPDGRR